MDISLWRKITPHISVSHTMRRFYRRYDHKLTYFIPGASAVPRFNELYDLSVYYTGLRPSDYKDESQYYQAVHQRGLYLAPLARAYQQRGVDTRYRIERNTVSIFASSLDQLYNLAQTDLSSYATNLRTLTTPASTKDQQVLDQDCIVVRSLPDHAYRVYIRDGFYRNSNERQALVDYLVNIGDQVRISKNYLDEIRGPSKYIRAGYFHVADPRLVDMISLIMPRLVQRVQQLVVA